MIKSTSTLYPFPLETERALMADRGLRDFRYFCKVILGLASPENHKAGWWDPLHDWLCDRLQARMEQWLAHRKDPDATQLYVALIMPRATGKTQIVSQALMLWLQLRDPELSIYLGNEALDLAESFLSGIKAHMRSNAEWHYFKWLYGDWLFGALTDRKDMLEHSARKLEGKDPSFGTYSPGSDLTGRHPDGALLDDLVSYAALKKDSNWFSFAYGAMTDLLPVIERNGFLFVPGTRYGDGDPIGRALKVDGIATVEGHPWGPYKPTPDGLWHVFFLDAELPRLPETPKVIRPAFPRAVSATKLANYHRRDPIKYASQYRNDPNAHELRPITEAQFNDLAVDLSEISIAAPLVFHFDTAFRHSNRRIDDSESVLCIVAHDWEGKGRVWVLEVHHSNQMRAEHFGDLVVEQYKKWTAKGFRVIAMTDEQVPGGKGDMHEGWLRDFFTAAGLQMPTFVVFNRQQGANKDTRIFSAIGFVTRGLVRFCKEGLGIPVLREQLCNHPHAHRKDVADAFADAFHPDLYGGRLSMLLDAEPFKPGGWEEAVKGHRFWERDIITEEGEEVWRHALGRSR